MATTASLRPRARGQADAAPNRSDPSRTGRIILWSLGLALWVFLLGSLLSFDPADPPGHAVAPFNQPGSLGNWMGPAGAFVAYHTFLMLGSGAWILLLCAAGWLAEIAYRGPITQPGFRLVGVLMLALAFSGFHALMAPTFSSFPEGGGGLAALAGVHELAIRFGAVGTALWLILLAVVGLTVAFDNWISATARAFTGGLNAASAARSATARAAARLKAASSLQPRENDIDDDQALDATRAALARPARSAKPSRTAEPRNLDDDDPGERTADETDETDELDADADEDEETEDADAEPESFDPEALRAKIAKLPVRFAASAKRTASEQDLDGIRARNMNEEADRNYVFPGLDLLEVPEESYSKDQDLFVREMAEALEGALRTYNISGEVVGIDSGPVITLYQVRLAPGAKVSSITAVSSDLARALRAINIRVVPNTEGLDTVGIEVPNRKKEKVRLRELMTVSDATSKMRLPLFLGKDASGAPLIQDLAAMPHMLIAGTTGSGKSVCMNAIIMGFLYTQKPSDLKLVLVDPKMVELSQFKNIPHLMCPVVTDMGKAAAILEWAVTKMDERYELLAEAGCRDITAYNALTWDDLKERFSPQSELEEARIPRKLPFMVFVIDELADLIITNKEVESSIVRIAQKARAVGIHLILATQRPQANVVTGLIKSNMPARISFKVASSMDSRIVLDQKGGELLLGQGDMLMLTPRSSHTIRAQGTLVDDSEIRKVTRFIRDISEPSYERQLVQMRSGGEILPEDHEQRMLDSAQEDPLFDRAVEIVLETKRGSVSLLQRRLAIGYTRASRLIELMGIAGIIGAHKGSVSREVLISPEEWEAIKRQAEADAQESSTGQDPSPQAQLFREPVVARDLVRDAPPHTLSPVTTGAAAMLEVEPPPFECDEHADSAAHDDDDEEADATAVEAADDDAAEVVVADADEEEDEEEEEEEEEDDEYEYIEVEEGEEIGDEYELVDDDDDSDEEEEEPADEAPEIKVSSANRSQSKPRG